MLYSATINREVLIMKQRDIFDIALRQSAYDCSCTPDDFLREENVTVISRKDPRARKYLDLPHVCNLVYYGHNVVATVGKELYDEVSTFLSICEHNYSYFETPVISRLQEILKPHGAELCFMAEYFLPELSALKRKNLAYEMRILGKEDFSSLYVPQWSNALSEKRPELDTLGIGAYDDGKLIGLAACSADCEDMWQIGIDVLPEYRGKGIASVLVGNLAIEILERDRVPFYCAAWSNIASVRTAVKSGFRPAWTELTAKPSSFVTKLTF